MAAELLNRAAGAARDARLRTLFAVFVDEGNFNAQSRNAQEIALRLDREKFLSTFFYARRPELRLRGLPHIRLLRTPRRLASLKIMRELIWGPYDLLFYVQPGRASRIYWRFRRLGRKKKVLATVEGSSAQIEATPESYRREFLAGLKRADEVYAITDHIRESMYETFGLKLNLQTIPVGVDLDLFRPADRSRHQSPWKVLFVGSIQPRKRPHLILELARQLRRQPVEFHLIGGAIGAPYYLQEIEERQQREHLGNVHLHGPLPPDQIAEWMRAADLFLLPSRLEGLPKVSLEAAATGLPCIVFDDYRTPSVRDGVTGFQVRSGDEMADRLRLLLADRELRIRMGRAAAEHVRPFSWDTVALQWQEALLSLYHGAPAP